MQQQQLQQLSAQHEALASTRGSGSYRRTPSPVRIQPYSSAVIQLAEKIKNEEHFANTLPVI